jgi:hypothetical protein
MTSLPLSSTPAIETNMPWSRTCTVSSACSTVVTHQGRTVDVKNNAVVCHCSCTAPAEHNVQTGILVQIEVGGEWRGDLHEELGSIKVDGLEPCWGRNTRTQLGCGSASLTGGCACSLISAQRSQSSGPLNAQPLRASTGLPHRRRGRPPLPSRPRATGREAGRRHSSNEKEKKATPEQHAASGPAAAPHRSGPWPLAQNEAGRCGEASCAHKFPAGGAAALPRHPRTARTPAPTRLPISAQPGL